MSTDVISQEMYGVIYEKYSGAVFAHILYFTSDREIAASILEDTFVEWWKTDKTEDSTLLLQLIKMGQVKAIKVLKLSPKEAKKIVSKILHKMQDKGYRSPTLKKKERGGAKLVRQSKSFFLWFQR